VMDQAKMTLNVLSMAGLALAIGMLVDNSIVALENIFRLREQGQDSSTAAIDGARTVSTAVTASTLTTVSVFVPVLFVPGIAGVLFRDMAVTICFSLTVSLIVALSFIPLSASRLLGTARAERGIARARDRQRLFRGLRRRYRAGLEWLLQGRRWVVGVVLVALLGAAAGLATALPMDFMARNDQSMLFLSVETPIGNNVHEAKRVMDEVVEHIRRAVRPEERRMIATDTGIGRGFVAIFAKGVHAGTIRVPLVSISQRQRSQAEIEAAVREELRNVPGVTVSVGMPNMMGSAGDIEVQVLGYDLEASRSVGLDLKEKLLALPDMAEVTFSMEEQKPEVEVRYERRKLAELGLSAAAVSSTLNAYFMGKLAGRYAEGGDEYDMLVRYGKEHRLDVDELRRMPISMPGGGIVPLDNVAKVTLGLGPVDITRIDQGRFTQLTGTLRDTYVDAQGKSQRKDLRRSIERVTSMLDAYPWPKGFSYHVGGSAEDFLTSFRFLGIALLVSMVMAGQFESFRQPFIILFTVPLAGIGVVAAFTLTQSTMDMSALIGVIMLVGIVVNNGIVMVDAANQLREQGLGRTEAIIEAASIRLRPVLMTSLTTILAMTPLALGIGEGSAGWAGLSKAVIGGLTAATFFTLFVVPTAYTFFARKVVPAHRLAAAPASSPDGGPAE